MRVLLVDDHPLILEIVPAVVKREFNGAKVHAVSRLEDALAKAKALPELDLVLLDLGLPGYSGVAALKTFCKEHPKTRVVVISATEDRDTIAACLKLGCRGYIPKTSTPPVIAAALRVVMAGGIYVPDEILVRQAETLAGPKLSQRQLGVLTLILKGYSNSRIAKELGIKESTVKQHVSDIFAAFGVASRAELLARAGRRDGG